LVATAELQELIQPTSLAAERILPVLDPLAPLLAAGGLACGSTVRVDGARSLALALVAGASATGSWTAVVGTGSVGWAAAAGLGLDLARTFVVPHVALGDWSEVTAALVDAVDVVMVSPQYPIRERDARRLSARARERGTVIVVVDARFGWPLAPDVVFEAAGWWSGMGQGEGRLRARRLSVVTTGRRAAVRARRADLWLPATDGSVQPVLGQPHSGRPDLGFVPQNVAHTPCFEGQNPKGQGEVLEADLAG
jgi:hypothetical protein